jgi:uncharacterized protein (TIGR03032 family)
MKGTNILFENTCLKPTQKELSPEQMEEIQKFKESGGKFEASCSRGFTSWIDTHNVSFAISTYQVGKLILIGLKDGKMHLFQRTFPRVMGMCVSSDFNSLYVSSQHTIIKFENILPKGQLHDGHDAVFLPKETNTTADVDIHDMVLDKDNKLHYVVTAFNCVSEYSSRYSFNPIWKPKFISKVVGEDRCHLNGLCAKNGVVQFATSVSESDNKEGWRDHRVDGGVLIDIKNNQVICKGLSMPHSPRFYRGMLWVLNAGTGELGYVQNGKFIPIIFCPGFLRGLVFVGDYAIIGSSKLRDSKAFQKLKLETKLEEQQVKPRCGMFVVNLKTKSIVQWVEFEGLVNEIYDVIALEGIRTPYMIGFMNTEISQSIFLPPDMSHLD